MGPLVKRIVDNFTQIRKGIGSQTAMQRAVEAAVADKELDIKVLHQTQISDRESGRGFRGLQVLEDNLMAIGIDPLMLVRAPVGEGAETTVAAGNEARLVEGYRQLPASQQLLLVAVVDMFSQPTNDVLRGRVMEDIKAVLDLRDPLAIAPVKPPAAINLSKIENLLQATQAALDELKDTSILEEGESISS